MSQSETISELTKALVKVQETIANPKRTEKNPFFNSLYADLATVLEVCREPLSTNGLAIVQTLDVEGDKSVLVTTLLHTSGEWISGKQILNPVKNDPQGIGSATTYARRYGVMAIVGLAPEDDDGEAASRGGESKEKAVSGASPGQVNAVKSIARKYNLDNLTDEVIGKMTGPQASEVISKYSTAKKN